MSKSIFSVMWCLIGTAYGIMYTADTDHPEFLIAMLLAFILSKLNNTDIVP